MTTEYQILLKNLRKYPLKNRQNLALALKNYVDGKTISVSTLRAVFYPEKKEISMMEKMTIGLLVSSFSRLSLPERARLIQEAGKLTVREKLTRQVDRFITSRLNECFGNFRTRNM